MRTLLSDLKRSILSWQFLAACIIGIIVTLIGAIDPILSAYDGYKMYGLVQQLGEEVIAKLKQCAVTDGIPRTEFLSLNSYLLSAISLSTYQLKKGELL